MRQFQVHILSKYGDKSVNPYFVYADTPSSQITVDYKQFLIDMGVYTKGRDFRLLGSYKRCGSKSGNNQRYLWLNDKKGSLTDIDFFSTLIQFQPKPSQVKYLISHIVDTINEGIPSSSSLRTVAPINGNCIVSDTGNCVVRINGGTKRFKATIKSIPKWIVTR